MVKIHKTMEKIKVGDRVRIIESYYRSPELQSGATGVVKSTGLFCARILLDNEIETCLGEFWNFPYEYLEIISETKQSTESQSKKIKQALRKICLSGMVIKSEKIISKVKKEIRTDYVFGDTILRTLRQLRQDGEVDYTVDKHSREYTFK